MLPVLIFELIVFIFAVVAHEVSHGFAAERLGDPTARNMGRLTMNPLKHIDPLGSIILPALMLVPVFFGGPPIIFGWAKPVPYDPRNFKKPKIDTGLVAAAGPITNIGIAVVFALLIRFLANLSFAGLPIMLDLLYLVVYINLLLALFNLLPIPPLDGSKVLFAVLPNSVALGDFMLKLEQYGMVILLILLFSGALNFISILIRWMAGILVG